MYATFDSNGNRTAFYVPGLQSADEIPTSAVPISDADYAAYRDEPHLWQRNPVNGVRRAAPPVVPTAEEIIRAKDARLQRHYDTVAQSKRYDTRYTCALRAGYPGPFQAEGAAFATWMDTCNAIAYQVMDECLAGTRAIPTDDELIAMMPPMVWP